LGKKMKAGGLVGKEKRPWKKELGRNLKNTNQ